MRKIVWVILLMACMAGCGKKDFLDAKPASNLFVPSTLDDFQAILDKDAMNETPVLGELSSDNYYLLNYSFWQSLTIKERNAYVWAADTYQGQGGVLDWNTLYQEVLGANVVLDGIDNVPVTAANQQQWNAIKGDAYFVRAYAFYNLAQVFAPIYDEATGATDMGIPIRLTTDINTPSTRASVKETYDQLLSDLANAYFLLPATIPQNNRNRASQPAVLALKARVYLSMRQYDKAGICADSCLRMYNTLMDYNVLPTPPPFPRTNPEAIYQSRLISTTGVLKSTVSNCIVDSNLYRSYDAYDLRKSLFFTINGTSGLPILKYSYNGGTYCFSGLATDEVYLIRAECYARAGNTAAAMTDLNTLLQTRWKNTVTFTPLTASTPAAALALVLTERRKELCFRGLRWTELRRLNKDGYSITLTRVLNGQTYQLAPGDLRYVFPIPPDVITLGGIQQNPR